MKSTNCFKLPLCKQKATGFQPVLLVSKVVFFHRNKNKKGLKRTAFWMTNKNIFDWKPGVIYTVISIKESFKNHLIFASFTLKNSSIFGVLNYKFSFKFKTQNQSQIWQQFIFLKPHYPRLPESQKRWIYFIKIHQFVSIYNLWKGCKNPGFSSGISTRGMSFWMPLKTRRALIEQFIIAAFH